MTQVIDKLLVPVVLLALLAFLTGCTETAVMRDPKTGSVAQCNVNMSNFWPTIAMQQCIDGYEKAGWEQVK